MAITPNRWGAVGCDMETILVPIAVAVISGPIVVLLQRLRRENAQQHAEGRILLRNVANKVDKVTSKLDEHIGWHKGKEQ